MGGIINFGPNETRLFLTLGLRRWYVVGLMCPQKRARFPSCRTGIIGDPECNGGNIARRDQRKAAGTARHQGGRSRNGADGKRAGSHDIPLRSKELVQRGGKLDVTYEARSHTGDG